MSQNNSLILVVEDEPPLQRYLRATLHSFGYRVEEAATGKGGLFLAASLKPDVILLDLGLPDMDGLEVAREIRGWSRVPIIVVSARGKEEDKVLALDLGVDDYLTKPFGSGELLARIRVALRRSALGEEGVTDAPATIGPLKVDFTGHIVTLDGVEVHLSPNEFNLLGIMIKNPDKVLTHRQLLHEIVGNIPSGESRNILRVYMVNLRKKLEHDPARPHLLLTEPGVGYRLNSRMND
jgi:two-component system KDP operon response regulator KdpE